MKTLLFLFLFTFVALCVGQHIQVCFPEVFTTDQATFIPAKEDAFMSKFWFSLKAKKERIDIDVIVEHDKRIHEKISLLFDYVKMVWYHVAYINQTAKCTVHTLSGNMVPLCLSKNAHHRGQFLFGGTMLVENYVEYEDINKTKVRLDIIFQANVHVPIRVTARDSKGVRVDEYWNFFEEVHHDAFVVPSVCQTSADVKTLGNTAEEIIARHDSVLAKMH